MAEIQYGTTTVGWATTYEMSMKAPLLKKRIFEKRSEAKTFIDDRGGTAVAGLLLSIISDTSENNGVYQVVKTSTTSAHPNGLDLKKLGSDLKIETSQIRKSIINSDERDGGLEVKLASHPGKDEQDYTDEQGYPFLIREESTYRRDPLGDLLPTVFTASGQEEMHKAVVNASGLDVVEKDDKMISRDIHGGYNEGLKVKLVHRVTPRDAQRGYTREDWRREDDSKNYNISGLEIHANTIVENKNKTSHGESKGLAVKPGRGIYVDREGVNTNGRLIPLTFDKDKIFYPTDPSTGDEPIEPNTPIYDLFRRLFVRSWDVNPVQPEWQGYNPICELVNTDVICDPYNRHGRSVELGEIIDMSLNVRYLDGKFECDAPRALANPWLDSQLDAYKLNGDGFVWGNCQMMIPSWSVTPDVAGTDLDVINKNDREYFNKYHQHMYEMTGNVKGVVTQETDYVYTAHWEWAESTRQNDQVDVNIVTNPDGHPKNLKSDHSKSDKIIIKGTASKWCITINSSPCIYWWFDASCTDLTHKFINTQSEMIAKFNEINARGVNRWNNKAQYEAHRLHMNDVIQYHIGSTLGTAENPNCIVAVPVGMTLGDCISPLGNYMTDAELTGVLYKQPGGPFTWTLNGVSTQYEIWSTYVNSPVNYTKLRFSR